MSIRIRDPKPEEFVLRVSRLAKETPDEAVRNALAERLERLKASGAVPPKR